MESDRLTACLGKERLVALSTGFESPARDVITPSGPWGEQR